MATLNLFNYLRDKFNTKQSKTRTTAEHEARIAKERGKSTHVHGGFRDRNLQAIFIPQRKKLKGWQRENRKYII